MAESDVETAIIGGGAAGLAAARRLHDAGVRCLIVEARERLELRLRDLLLSRPGTALLKRWLETGAGRDDIEAARELIRRLGPDDPAHAAAASRLRRLSRS